MRKWLLLCLILAVKFSYASPGDTTWVQAHHLVQHPNYGNYDTLAQFPKLGAGTFQRIIMEWTIGKYVCPGAPQYCSDWDYDVNLYAMPQTGDTIELGRLITPYGKGPRMPANWSHRYYFDVSDAYTLLTDSVRLRILYKGYSGGFTSSVRFAFIEGTPSRDVLDYKRLWTGSKHFGGPVSIDSTIKVQQITPPANMQSATMKFTITGHGADNNGCSEFCSKWYEVKLNNNMISHKDIWRNDCGVNQLYPQSGTWIYNRANWCPGDKVHPFIHPLPAVSGANPYNIDIDFQPYNQSGANNPSYSLEAVVYHYGAFNKQLDLAIDEVIVPTDYEGRFRDNPSCNSPRIKVKNLGEDTIHSAKIIYGYPNQGTSYIYTASLSLAAMEEAEIVLPATNDLLVSTGDSNIFEARLSGVNGIIDDEPSNDYIKSQFTGAVVWDPILRFELRSNNTLDNRWKLYDAAGAVVAQRTPTSTGVWHYDTVKLTKGCYKLVVEDDGCDGLRWWANTAQGIGNFRVEAIGTNSPLPMKGYTFGNTFEGDFGCIYEYHFVVDSVLSVREKSKLSQTEILITPNPASNQVNIQIDPKHLGGWLEVLDITGRQVEKILIKKSITTISVADLPSGIYLLKYNSSDSRSMGKLEVRH